MTFVSVLFFIASLLFAAFLPRKSLKIIVGTLSFIYIATLVFDLLLFFIFGKHFGLFVVSFFNTSIKGAPFTSFAREILILSAICFAILLFCIVISIRMIKIDRISKFSFLFIPWIVAAFLLNPFCIYAYEFYSQLNPRVDDIKKQIYPYLAVPAPRKPTKRKNIVYIFLESFDRAYTDEQLFSGLTPRLNALKNRMDFTNITQVRDTEFTIKGFFGAHCAANYTFVPSDELNSKNFSTNITCASEILKSVGYYAYFLKGASLAFQGTDGFLKQRRYDEMKGKEQILEQNSAARLNEWGVQDDDMLGVAYGDFERLSKKEKPFLMGLITLSTHSPNGFVPNSCEDLYYSESDAQMLRAVHCTDRLVSDFIEKIRTSKYGKDTIVVVQNDHPLFYSSNTSGDFGDKLKGSKDLFVIFDDDLNGEFTIEKRGTSFDTFTTVLGYLGILDEMNFGRNLLARDSLPFLADSEFFNNASKVFTKISYDEAVKAQKLGFVK